jgi:hypothetical protein
VHPRGIALFVALLAGLCTAAAAEVTPTYSLRLSTPQGVSASLGLLVGRARGHTVSFAKGLLLEVEPGTGGGKLGIGVGVIGGPEGRLLGAPSLGFAAKMALLRTWGHPVWASNSETYLGGEIDATIRWVKVSFGVLGRVQGSSDSKGTLVTAGAGFGF